MSTPAPPTTTGVASASAVAAAEKARQTAAKYSGEGQKFRVQYLGTQEVSSAKGDAVIADCLKELRTLFKDVAVHLPKVTIVLHLNGLTVIDDKSKMESIKVPLEHISYVCLDPADSSVFSFIVRSSDTISSKGLRLHAFVSHPQTAITFNRCTREVFDFMARLIRAKKKMAAAQEAQKSTKPTEPAVTSAPGAVAGQTEAISQTDSAINQAPEELVQFSEGNQPPPTAVWPEKKSEQAVFDEWKDLSKELDDIGEDLGITGPIHQPITSTPTTSPPVTEPPSPEPVESEPAPTPLPSDKELLIMTTNGSDPFESSFFNTSISGTPTNTKTQGPASPESGRDPNMFDNPVFNGGLHGIDSPNNAVSPEGKQLMFPSRPRPKGKSLDSLTPVSPPAVPEEEARGISLSPTAEEEVKNIVANTDPFSPPPPPLDASQFPQANSSNGSGLFQPSPLASSSNSSSGYFSPGSVIAQDSIQLVNPVYQTPTNGGIVFSPPPSQNPFVTSSPVVVPMQQAYFGPVPQSQLAPLQQMTPIQPQQSVNITGQQPMPPVGVNYFDGSISPNLLTSPPPPAPMIPQSTSKMAAQMEQRDKMFADLLPKTSHPIPEKKKKFEPEVRKMSQPSLAELQEKKKKEEEEAFRAANSATKQEVMDWPDTPFNDALAPTPFDNPPQVTDTSTTQDAQVMNFEEFDTAFKKAEDKEQNVASAFEVEASEPQSKPAATNDPFAPINATPGPKPMTSSPWNTFEQ